MIADKMRIIMNAMANAKANDKHFPIFATPEGDQIAFDIFRHGYEAAPTQQYEQVLDVVWISVDDHMPEINVPVFGLTNETEIGAFCLVDYGDDSQLFAAYNGFGDMKNPLNYDVDDEYILDAWMPLPKVSV